MNIGIVGLIHENKGAAIVAEMANQIQKFNLPITITVVGEIDVSDSQRERWGPVLRCTGRYERSALARIIGEQRIDLCFFSSPCPETFSYVTSEIMGLGLPLAVYALGAPPERVREYPKGLILENVGDAGKTIDELLRFHRRLQESQEGTHIVPHMSIEDARSADVPNSRVYVYTSANIHYLPKARLLFQSLKEHHPEFRCVLGLVDGIPDWFDLAAEPFDEVIIPEDLSIDRLDSWIFRHDVVELCTGIKPFLATHLLNRPGCSKVIYFDPDMVLFSRLDDLVQGLGEANIVLTPHLTMPEHKIEHIVDNEICSLKHGVYNLGFIGLNNTIEARKFVHWWSNRLYHFCRADIPNGLFTDQKWIDLVPAFFEGVAILKNPRFNVATWNLTTRKLTGGPASGYLVDGQPLGFYHFTGFDSGAHMIMARKNIPGNLALMQLLQGYKERLAGISNEREAEWRWRYGYYKNGEEITAAHRRLYRDRVDLQQAFPSPAETKAEASYYEWLRQQGLLDAEETAPYPFRTSIPASALTGRDECPPTLSQLVYELTRWLWHRLLPSGVRRGLRSLLGRSSG